MKLALAWTPNLSTLLELVEFTPKPKLELPVWAASPKVVP